MKGTASDQGMSPDPCPELLVERGPKNEGVGAWVPEQKHRLLCEYLNATRHAWGKWTSRVLIDPFSGPGRIQVKGEPFTREGGAIRAWRALSEVAPFTSVLVGDIEAERSAACARRLTALSAPAADFVGPASETVLNMVKEVPRHSLCFALLDPYNLESLSFSIIQELARCRVDLAINFSTMDLQRNAELEFDPHRARFDAVAPGWRNQTAVQSASKQNVKVVFFQYWCRLIRDLGFSHSKEMPLVRNGQGHPIYRMVFFARHKLPNRIWDDIAHGPNRSFEF